MPRLTLPSGTSMAYEETGDGSPVLVLHDADQAPQDLHPLTDALRPTARVIVPHLAQPTDPAAVGADAAALLTASAAAPASVIGIGAGASVALVMAADHAAVVHRVIADSPALPLTPEDRLGDIMCHVLLVWGEGDTRIPQTDRVRIALQVPRVLRVGYPCAGGAFASHRDAFLADLRDWLHRDPAPARLPMNEERATGKRGPVLFDI